MRTRPTEIIGRHLTADSLATSRRSAPVAGGRLICRGSRAPTCLTADSLAAASSGGLQLTAESVEQPPPAALNAPDKRTVPRDRPDSWRQQVAPPKRGRPYAETMSPAGDINLSRKVIGDLRKVYGGLPADQLVIDAEYRLVELLPPPSKGGRPKKRLVDRGRQVRPTARRSRRLVSPWSAGPWCSNVFGRFHPRRFEHVLIYGGHLPRKHSNTPPLARSRCRWQKSRVSAGQGQRRHSPAARRDGTKFRKLSHRGRRRPSRTEGPGARPSPERRSQATRCSGER